MNTNTPLNSVNVRRAKRARFNPLTNLTPEALSRSLDAFETGNLREASVIWEALEQRDDLLRAVISKRKKSAARHGWAVLPNANLNEDQKREAEAHAQALTHFYSHLECEHAVDSAQKGGFKLLARQMMDAVGKKFAVHEILWRRNEASESNPAFVSAKFRFVPLGFFENTTGRLRFLEHESAMEGRELEPGAWMVTAGDGLMMASSTAWMFKHLSLDDWLKCSKKNGTPGLRGISTATRDSAEWNALERSLADILEGDAVVHGSGDDVQVLDLLPRSTMPFPQLVERVDRLLATVWRGADLSTLSRDRGYGASLQEKETCALEEDDAEMLTETLHRYVDEWVIRYAFGEGVKPLAHVKVLVSPRECTTSDIQIDEFLIRNGAPLAIRETMHRYGRPLPQPGEPIFRSEMTFRRKNGEQANYPESSQNLGKAEEMDNQQGVSQGPSVTFRDSSPASDLDPNANPNPPLENDFTLTQPDWLQLSPYGDFPHSRGLQRVNRAAAETMVSQFNSFRGRLGRLFGGVPFYVGHPDLPHTSELADRKAYGWIAQLEARDDGLYGQVKWSEAGLELLRNAHFKFLSPYWEAKEIGTENGRRVYQPMVLVSVGLTNQPNIPVKPLANENPSPCSNRREETHSSTPTCSATVHRTENQSLLTSTTTLTRTSLTNNLGVRRSELVPIHNRRNRIQEAVLSKVRLGLAYDDAWDAVKQEHSTWFQP